MKVVCFDLDDTLYKEIDYLQEAYKLIAHKLWGNDWNKWYLQMFDWYIDGQNVFARICEMRNDVSIESLLHTYRYEVTKLVLPLSDYLLLSKLKAEGVKLGIISDGRQITQMNKIKALGLDEFFDTDMILISETFGSEKPCEANYRYFMDKFPDCDDFTYVGDNPQKDFLAPNILGWNTICLLDDGRNIHKQDFSLPEEYLPKVKINHCKSLRKIAKYYTDK